MNDIDTSTLTDGADITAMLGIDHDVAEITATLVINDPPSEGADWDWKRDCPFVRVKVYLPTEYGALRRDLRSPETVFLGSALSGDWGVTVSQYQQLRQMETKPDNLSACLAEARERLSKELTVLDCVVTQRAQRLAAREATLAYALSH